MRQLLLTIFSLCCFAGFSQSFYPPVLNYSIKDYGKDRNPENYCVVQDQRGVIYVGHSHGVLEFDGEKWTFIQVGYGSFVRAMDVDETGMVYVGVYGDFGYLQPDSTGQLTFQSLLPKIAEEDQFFSTVWRIFAGSESVYFQTEEALFIYNISTEAVEVVYPETSFHTSFLINDQIFLRERETGLVKWESGALKPLPGTAAFADYGVFGLHLLEDDSLFIITQELGLYKWKDGGMRQLPDENPQPITELGVFGSTRLYDGDFALNTFGNGVLIIDENGRIKHVLDRNIGIRSNVVQDIYQDRDLNLWLALENGIAKVNYHSPMSYFDEKSGLEGNVQAMIRFNGRIFAGTSHGLYAQTSDTVSSRKFEKLEMIDDQVWDFLILDQQLIVASAKGIFKMKDGQNFQLLNSNGANTICYDEKNKRIYTGGPKGIFVYDQAFRIIWEYPNNFSTFLGAAVDPNDANTVWLGTTRSGVIRLKMEGADQYKVDSYGDFDGLLDNLGIPIIYDDSLIFGAKDGLFFFVNEDIMFEELKDQLTPEERENPAFYKGIFENYTLHDSLFNGQILLLTKGKNRTWYCNETKIGFYDHQTKTFKNRPFWGINFGRINSFYLEEDGVLWIGAAEGLIRYEDNDVKQYESQFYALIRNVRIPRGDTLFNGAFQSDSGVMRIHQKTTEIPQILYKNNDIQFFFAAPYFEDEHQPEYRYKLAGSDEYWSDWEGKSEAKYNNLHEGQYTFIVEARNVYGQVSEQASYTFEVLPPWYRTTWAYMLYGLAFILILLIGVRISSQRLKQKNLWLEGVVEERTREISQKNTVLEHQQKEIQDSINYAQRIQEAILPLEDEMKKWIPNSFVLFRPKDVVSGDFYWFLERDNQLVIICADCTGHGVPGAFMSMIGSDRLNNIVSENKVTAPGAILSELNRAIKKSLKQDGQKNATRDGMDAAVCTIDLAEQKLYYAGANRPLWVIENAALTEIKATKVAVAGFTPEDQAYEEHVIPLKKGLKFYMTSDGYADQFGGERNKKFKVKNMKNLIAQIADKPFAEQKALLEKELLSWMGDFEQVDDICVIGFQV